MLSTDIVKMVTELIRAGTVIACVGIVCNLVKFFAKHVQAGEVSEEVVEAIRKDRENE